MRYKLLGRSGLRVSELALGTMTFGEDWGWGASQAESRKIFERFAEAGGNFVDTACNYTEGTSERFVGEFVSRDRDYFVVATKYTLRPNGANQRDPNAGGNHRKNMIRTVEESLQRLNTETIDLLWLHMWDETTPVEEVLRALDDLVRAGKVHYVGMSDSPAWAVSYGTAIAELRGWSRFVALQLPYSLLSRDPEREQLPMAKALDLAVTPWGVLNSGGLTGKYNVETDEPKRFEQAGPKTLNAAELLMRYAEEFGRSPAQLAINWVRAQQGEAQVIPIVGARSGKQMVDNLGCLEFELSSDQLEKLDAVSEFQRGFPRDFLGDDHVRSLTYGETFGLIDNHRR